MTLDSLGGFRCQHPKNGTQKFYVAEVLKEWKIFIFIRRDRRGSQIRKSFDFHQMNHRSGNIMIC
jgi:hypothetical protein